MQIYNLRIQDFDKVVALGNKINGINYLDRQALDRILQKSCKYYSNCSFVAYEGEELIAFRLTYAPGGWEPDKWCCPDKWGIPAEQLCFFKANMVDENYRGQGIGPMLLKKSIEVAKQQGAVGGVTHIWMQSPGQSAYKYFTRAGGKLVCIHPDRWKEDYRDFGYICSVCGNDCHCDGAEMILYFNTREQECHDN
jgi:GNAT superfamily N-acetyltransferase